MHLIQAQEAGVPFDYEIASDLPTGVRIDEKRLRQVLLNLINNAIKFASGNVVFRVSAKSLTTPDAKLPYTIIHCEVEDNGIGISPDKLDDIFLRFTRLTRQNLQLKEQVWDCQLAVICSILWDVNCV